MALLVVLLVTTTTNWHLNVDRRCYQSDKQSYQSVNKVIVLGSLTHFSVLSTLTFPLPSLYNYTFKTARPVILEHYSNDCIYHILTYLRKNPVLRWQVNPTRYLFSGIFNNYWMRLSMIWRIMQIEESVIRPWRKRLSEIFVIFHIIRKPNSIFFYYSLKIFPEFYKGQNVLYVQYVFHIFITLKCKVHNIRYFFLKHFSGPESGILEFDWLLTRVPPVQFFPIRTGHPDRFCYGNRAN